MLGFALSLILPSAALAQSWIPFDYSLPCLSNPIPVVESGDSLEFQLFNTRNTTCEATLSFAHPLFLPLIFDISPPNCAGEQMAELKIPSSSPDGIAAIQWQCIGQQAVSCALLNITNGAGDPEGYELEKDNSFARVHCYNQSSFLQSTSDLAQPALTPVPTLSCSSEQ